MLSIQLYLIITDKVMSCKLKGGGVILSKVSRAEERDRGVEKGGGGGLKSPNSKFYRF